MNVYRIVASFLFAGLLLGGTSLSAQDVKRFEHNVDPSLKPNQSFRKSTYQNYDFGFALSIPDRGWKALPDPKL